MNKAADFGEFGTFYRALSLDEVAKYKLAMHIPAQRPRAGLYNYKTEFGRRLINRVANWVKAGRGPKREYDILVSYSAPLNEFEEIPFESEVYKNKVPVSLDKVIVELVSPRMVVHEVVGMRLSDAVSKILD